MALAGGLSGAVSALLLRLSTDHIFSVLEDAYMDR